MVRYFLLIILALAFSSWEVMGQEEEVPIKDSSSSKKSRFEEEGLKGGERRRPRRLTDMAEDPEIRERVHQLMNLSKEELMQALQKWPKFQQMSLEEQGKMLMRIQEFKERRRHMAREKARELDLKLPRGKSDEFENSFWEKRFEVEKKIREQVEPLKKQLEAQMNEALKAEFKEISDAEKKKKAGRLGPDMIDDGGEKPPMPAEAQ